MSQYASIPQLQQFGISYKALKAIPEPDQLAAIVAASGEADTYMQKVVGIPLQEPYPEAVTVHVCRIAIFNMFNVIGFNRDGDDKIIEDNYERAIRFFTAVAKGVIELGPNVTPPVDNASDLGDVPLVMSDPGRGYPDTGYV
jgi:phage gp36-like protein